MAGVALDTSVVVAGLVARHEHHERASIALTTALTGDQAVILPIPALIESYSVLTRLPAPFRISPSAAHEALTRTFAEKAVLAPLSSSAAWSFLESAAQSQIAGGSTYDAAILACARAAGASRLLTLNAKDFLRLKAAEDLLLWVP
jgi:predicted nucleic acid-binding protein